MRALLRAFASLRWEDRYGLCCSAFVFAWLLGALLFHVLR